MTSTAVSKPTSQIRWPRATAADSILCTIVRDTRGVPLDHAQRYNFFPATPLCCVTAVFAGDWHVIERDEEMERPWTGTKVPGLAFSGPQPQPPMSWNPGATFAAMIVLYPDALAAVTGIDLSPFTGRVVAAERALPQKVLGPCRRFFEAVERDRADDGAAGLETEFEVMSAGLRPPAQSANRIRDWKRGVVHRAAGTGSGHSVRQIARRLRSWTGLSERVLHGLGHTEEFYARLRAAVGRGDVDWADLAAESGFADQPHMIRRVRQHTGFTPEQLRRHARDDEAFWGYRLLGQYFEGPGAEPSSRRGR